MIFKMTVQTIVQLQQKTYSQDASQLCLATALPKTTNSCRELWMQLNPSYRPTSPSSPSTLHAELRKEPT